MMPEETLFRVGARTARVLAPGADEPRVQRLCEACRDYYELNAGTPPSASAARDLFTAGPPSARPEDKLVLGVFEAPGDGSVRGGRLVGLIEGFRGYPEAGAWWLGLVMLHPDERGRGLGAALVEAFVAWAGGQGARCLWLGVTERNERALRFWQGQGFVFVRHTGETRVGERVTRVTVLRRVM